MQKITNWQLSFLVLAASVLSLLFLQQKVFAVWIDPPAAPGSTNLNAILFNPLTQNINLNEWNIHDSTNPNFIIDPGGTIGFEIEGSAWAGWFDGNVNVLGSQLVINDGADTADLCLNDFCTKDLSGLGGLWTQSSSDPTEIYYNVGNVGIGVADPQEALHILGNALLLEDSSPEIFLQDDTGEDWRIEVASDTMNIFYGNYDTDTWPVRGSNWPYTFTKDGRIGIYDITPTANIDIDERNSSYNAEIQLSSQLNSYWGIYNDGIGASGDFRLWSEATGIDVFTLETSGRIGINTNNPQSSLHFYKNADEDTLITFQNDNSTASSWTMGDLQTIVGISNSFRLRGGDSVSPNTILHANNNGDIVLGGDITNGLKEWSVKIKTDDNDNGVALSADGDVVLENGTTSSGGTRAGYLQLDEVSAINSSHCNDDAQRGRMVIEYTNNRLYICAGQTLGWKYIDLSALP